MGNEGGCITGDHPFRPPNNDAKCKDLFSLFDS